MLYFLLKQFLRGISNVREHRPKGDLFVRPKRDLFVLCSGNLESSPEIANLFATNQYAKL